MHRRGEKYYVNQLQRLDGALNKDLEYFSGLTIIYRPAALTPSVIQQQFEQRDFRILANGADPIGGDLYHHRRKMKDGQILFLSNASMVQSSKGKVNIRGRGVVLMDLMAGQMLDYPVDSQPGGNISLSFDIPPAGSLMFYISDTRQSGLKKYRASKGISVIKGSPVKTIRPAENTLMIDFCDLQLPDTLLNNTHVGVASKTAFMHYGFNRNPWNHQVQFKDHIVARDTFSAGTGFTATYHFYIDSRVRLKNSGGCGAERSVEEIKVNGKLVKSR